MSLGVALLLDATLKASLLCLLVFAVAALCRRRSAGLRHDLWLTAIAGSVLLPLTAGAIRMSDWAAPVAPVHHAVVAVTPILPAWAPPRTIELVDRIWSGDGGGAAFGTVGLLLVLLWLAGFTVEMLRSCVGWRAAATIARRARPFARHPGRTRFYVRTTGELSAPAVFGLAPPTVLLPADAARWPDERLEAVLAHEAAHVRRRDGATELLVQLACALQWFNPLVRAAAAALRRERELACDEEVVASGIDARLYAGALVEVARDVRAARRSPLLAMAATPQLERRVRRLLAARAPVASRGTVRAFIVWPPLMLFLAGAALTAPAAGILGAGSVQPREGPLHGVDDPLSERLPFDYEGVSRVVAALPATGAEGRVIAVLQGALRRTPRGPWDLVRERAIWVLAQADGEALLGPLAARTGHRDWRVRAYAAWGLTAIGDRRTTPLLVALLDDPVWRVRAMAADGLAQTGDPAAAGAVAGLADDPAWQVRMAALEYLGRVRDPALALRLRPLLDDPHNGTRIVASGVSARR